MKHSVRTQYSGISTVLTSQMWQKVTHCIAVGAGDLSLFDHSSAPQAPRPPANSGRFLLFLLLRGGNYGAVDILAVFLQVPYAYGSLE